MGAGVAAKAHVERLLLFVEVTSILLLMLPLAPRVEDQKKNMSHSDVLALQLEACSLVI